MKEVFSSGFYIEGVEDFNLDFRPDTQGYSYEDKEKSIVVTQVLPQHSDTIKNSAKRNYLYQGKKGFFDENYRIVGFDAKITKVLSYIPGGKSVSHIGKDYTYLWCANGKNYYLRACFWNQVDVDEYFIELLIPRVKDK